MPKNPPHNKYFNPKKIGISKKKAEKFKCPKCGNVDVIDYDDSFECPKCNLEFEKEDFKNNGEDGLDSIMSVKEMLAFLSAFKKEGETDEEFQKRLKDADLDNID